ncbi:CaiB/BaiF CoA-transferase family protein [Brevibacterium daeguense]|uniref:CaiB/BaiF CoA-transferase family protein n=1 Tax=Brevibacterium daeguense TaxID=909936 RepID=A0ABP8EFT7_9MICO|nr:CaiB/BaiF CoA-transferase family protein [Brevibacterium daeguense]
MILPLDGVRVIEISHMVMGPSCGMILADLGAEVIKVEPRGDGDKTRYLPGSGSGLFPSFNRNKKSFQADLADPDDQETVRMLLASADVVVENFRTGKMESYGLGYEALKEINPGIVYCSLKGFLGGPYGNRPALDEVVQMLGGLGYMTGPPGRPLRAGASVNDIMGGMFGVIGIMSALMVRERTGEGAHLTSSLFENNVFLVGNHMVQAELTGEDVEPMPNRMAAWAVYDIFRSAEDQMIFVAAVSDSQWRVLCEVFGLHRLAEDEDLATNPQRVAQRDRIHAELQSVLGSLPLARIEELCDGAGLPYAKVNKPSDLASDPHLLQTGALTPTRLPDGTEVLVPLLPLAVNGEHLPKRSDIPAPGEHTQEILNSLEVNSRQANTGKRTP